MSSKFPHCKQIINKVIRSAFSKLPYYLFSRCLYLLLGLFIKVLIQSILVMNLDKDARFICVWLLHLFDDLRIVTDTKISIKSSFMEIVFSIYVQQKLCAKQKSCSSLQSKLPTLACGLGKKWERYKANQLFVSNFGTTCTM